MRAVIKYQVICLEYSDKRFIEPVSQAIRSHFNLKKFLKEGEFKKFKRRTFKLLIAILIMVLLFQGLLPYVIEGMDHRMAGSLHNVLDVFSWVMLWKPSGKSYYKLKVRIFLVRNCLSL
jgi:flagellar biosynthesis protein FlhB